jgi:hypothetical protein
MPRPDDAHDVLCALRLGWALAELRGRTRPGGPSGDVARMPDRIDHPLPLRIERGGTELRLEAQAVIASLARGLHVDRSVAHRSFSAGLEDNAKVLAHTRTPTAAAALRRALELLEHAPPVAEAGDEAISADNATSIAEATSVAEALIVLRTGVEAQRRVVEDRLRAVAACRRAVAVAELYLAEVAGHPELEENATEAVHRAEVALHVDLDTVTGEAHGLAALDVVIGTLEQSRSAAAGIESIRQRLAAIATDAGKLWAKLADLIWVFDAHLQDTLTAASETQAIAYQLGRGLAETYWALDPDSEKGTMSWDFLLGDQRCSELARLVGRLSAYHAEYTAAAIAGSVEVWKQVVATKAWLGDRAAAQEDLYRQTRRWFELLVLGQDPTTLVRPTAVMRSYRTLARAIQIFWPQLVATIIGLLSLVALLVLLNLGNVADWAKTASGILALAGLSIAGLTGALKNGAQAMLKRLRQDSYTDLVAIAVQTAPPPPRKRDLQRAINQRALTPATPN